MMAAGKGIARWPLLVLAAPAAVTIWSGWVGLGALCGFGIVQPLQGWVGWHLNLAITLPVGVEAYGTYALGAWVRLSGWTGPLATRARTFARSSAIGSLALGMCGQVAYHLLVASRAKAAPWPVIVLVSCLPVLVVGLGTGLYHLWQAAADEITAEAADREDARAQREDARAQREAARQARTAVKGLAPYGNPDSGSGPYGSGPHSEPRTDRSGLVRVPPVRGVPVRDQRPGKDIDREALVAELAAEIMADSAWRPDYRALAERTGCRRSYCEKLVRDARREAARKAADLGSRTDGQLAGSLA